MESNNRKSLDKATRKEKALFFSILILSVAFAITSYNMIYSYISFGNIATELTTEINGLEATLDTTYKIQSTMIEVNDLNRQADLHYDISTQSYQLDQFTRAINECETSREFLAIADGKWKKINEISKTNLPDTKYKPIIQDFNELSRLGSSISLDLYQACEHIETASLHYKNNKYDSGDISIQTANVFINRHDSSVENFNKILQSIKLKTEAL